MLAMLPHGAQPVAGFPEKGSSNRPDHGDQGYPHFRTMVGGEFVYINPDQDPDQEVKYWYPITRPVVSLPVPAN